MPVRFVFLNDDMTCLCWAKNQGARNRAKSVPIVGMAVKRGRPRKAHKKESGEMDFSGSTFTIVLRKKMEGNLAIDFWCASSDLCDQWTLALALVLPFLQSRFEPDSDEAEYRSALLKDMMDHSLVRYAETTLKRKRPIEDMSFSHTPIRHSLTRMATGFDQQAREMFEMVMGYMGDFEHGNKCAGNFVLLERIINLAESVPTLRNEFYCQLAKQTTDNPNYHSLVRGWQLITGAVRRFLPQDEKLISCMAFHAARARYRPDGVGGLAFYVYDIIAEGKDNQCMEDKPSVTMS